MATYKEIKGVTIQTLDEDPVLPGGSWGSGGSLPQNQRQFAGFGTQTAAIVAGGNTPNPKTGNSYTYDGASWSEVAELNTARFALGFSTNAPQSSGIVFGGQHPQVANAETWNGSSWTEVADLNTTRSKLGGAGASATSALAFGGTQDPGDQATTELWNGSTWTEVNDLNTARYNPYKTGIATAALAAGGANPNVTANVESWNGSSWTETTDIPVAASSGGAAGLYTNSIIFGGASNTANLATTLSWDGSAWTELSAMSTARQELAQAGGSSGADTALAVAGYTSTEVSTVEEWSTPPATQAKLREGMLFLSGGTSLKGFGRAAGIPAGAFASGGSLNTARRDSAGFGLTQNAALIATGNDSPQTVNVETYDGTSFTEVSNVNASRNFVTGGGTQTAGMIYGGSESPSPARTAIVEEWDGTSWTEIADVNTGRYGGAGSKSGSPTNQLFFCGNRAPNNNSGYTESWNGTAWTELTDASTNRRLTGGVGSGSTDALVFGGDSNPSPYTANTEQWDGTSWTEKNNLNAVKRFTAGSAGNTSSALCMGGEENPGDTANNEFWNGTSWTELNNLSAVTAHNAGAGSSALAISMGRGTGSTDTEEFTADATLSTVTVS